MKSDTMIKSLLSAAEEMRHLQVEYFKTRNPKVLAMAKKSEKDFDDLCKNCRERIEQAEGL